MDAEVRAFQMETDACNKAAVSHWAKRVEKDGLALLSGVFSKGEVDRILEELEERLRETGQTNEAVRGGEQGIYAARNVLQFFPAARTLWRKPPLVEFLGEVFGSEFGLVRGLYFDKPPGRTWSLPWHKDLLISVSPQCQRSVKGDYRFRYKAGIPHVEAPRSALENMLTLRIHLDRVDETNGPLNVIPGSHRSGKRLTLDEGKPTSIWAERGDILAIRPLVTHNSGKSYAGTARHRRILHLEFAADRELADGLAWHDFIR